MNRALIQEAYNLLEPIPENEWITREYFRGTKCCAVGHYIRLKLNKPAKDIYFMAMDDEIALDLRKETRAFIAKKSSFYTGNDIANVNNSSNKLYPQSTAKARVMALLQDMLAA